MNRILTDLYRFEHLEGKSKSRYDCKDCTGGYEPLESIRNKAGDLFLYLTDVPDNFKADIKRKADKCISHTKNISSLFIPDITKPWAYGDVRGTSDAIIVLFKKDCLAFDVFIARGQKNNKRNLYTLLADQELNQEMKILTDKIEGYQNSNL